jgi:hypothetical protein
MTKQSAKFTNSDGAKLTIFAKEAKRGGFNIGASLKSPGEPAKTGCRSRFDTEAEATAAFAELKQQATKGGWVTVARKDRSAFSVIPPATLKAPKRSAAA